MPVGDEAAAGWCMLLPLNRGRAAKQGLVSPNAVQAPQKRGVLACSCRRAGGLRRAEAFAGCSLPSPALPRSFKEAEEVSVGRFPLHWDWFGRELRDAVAAGELGLAKAPCRSLSQCLSSS